MLPRRFLNCFPMTFLVVLCSTNMLFDSIVADKVQMMSKLLGNPGWRDLDPLVIKDGRKRFTVTDMLGPVGSSDTVTVDNVDSKIQQAHDFLSCHYAIDFLTYNAYLDGLWDHCISMDDSSPDRRDCLDKYWQLCDPETLVSRMKGALLFLNSISAEIALKPDVFDVLTKFEEAYQPVSVGGKDVMYSLETVMKTYHTLSSLHVEVLFFIRKNCGPELYITEKKFGNPTYSWVRDIIATLRIKRTDLIDKIHSLVNDAISDFLLDYTLLGFAFNTESNVTVLNENPDLAERVRQINEMLKHSGWSVHLYQLSFTVNDQQHGVQDIKVTEENANSEIRHIYALLIFYYIEILRDLLKYITEISECYTPLYLPNETLDLIELYVRTIEKCDPVIMRMKGSLVYLQRLSPQTGLDKAIIKVLEFYKNSTEAICFRRSTLSWDLSVDISTHRDTLHAKMSRYRGILGDFHGGLIKYIMKLGVVSSKHRNPGISETFPADMEKKVDEIINEFNNTVFPSFGFLYSPHSNPTCTLRSEN